MRLFLGIPLPSELKRELGAWPRPVGGLRWTHPGQLHITLVFLGETPVERLREVCTLSDVVSQGIGSFELRLAAAGSFPDRSTPRVLWLGVHDPAGGCLRWVLAATTRLAALGVAVDQRPYTPHVTLARTATPAGVAQLRRWLAAPPPPPAQSFRVSEITLFESELSPAGPRHRIVHTAALA